MPCTVASAMWSASIKEGLIDVLVDEGKALVSTLDEMLDYEAVAATMSAHTEDAREGTKSFVEKRKPEFKGR